MKTATRLHSLVTTLRQRLTSHMHLGLLHPGDRLPSVRVSASEFEVDPRLVLAAYRTLEAEGLVELRARSGVFVAPVLASNGIPAGRIARSVESRIEWLVDCFAESLAAGVSAPHFFENVRRALESRRLRAVVVDRNNDQLWSTADELRRDYGFDADVLDLDRLQKRERTPSIVSRADLIVTASPHPAIRALAASAQVPLLEVTMCPDLFAEVRRLLRTQPVYFVVADPRFAGKLDQFLAPSRGKSRLHVLVYDRDDLTEIPSHAPVYLTRLAREHMRRAQAVSHAIPSGADATVALTQSDGTAERSLLNRIMPDARVFSESSARALLDFVVRTNFRAGERIAEYAPSLQLSSPG